LCSLSAGKDVKATALKRRKRAQWRQSAAYATSSQSVYHSSTKTRLTYILSMVSSSSRRNTSLRSLETSLYTAARRYVLPLSHSVIYFEFNNLFSAGYYRVSETRRLLGEHLLRNTLSTDARSANTVTIATGLSHPYVQFHLPHYIFYPECTHMFSGCDIG
jgi:hypothetical protein